MAVREDEVMQLDSPSPDVLDTDDGDSVVRMEPDEPTQENPDREFYDNFVQDLDPVWLNTLSGELEKMIERDKAARTKREKDYSKSIERSGLTDTGEAAFTGASRVRHPMLSEAAIDFASGASKELLPANGPVKSYIPGEGATKDRLDKADRKRAYMNWQFVKQVPEFRAEMDQLLPQIALSGSQYMRIVPDRRRGKHRFTPRYVPSDQILYPYHAASFATAERQEYMEPVSGMEFRSRVRDGMYVYEGQITDPPAPEESDPEKASRKVSGEEDSDNMNEDGLRIVAEFNIYMEVEGDDQVDGEAPYLISFDVAERKILGIQRNWEQDDPYRNRMQWIVEFPFVPWRGSGSIGLGHIVGSLAGGAAGAMRSLLDSALVNNIPTLLKLKGANLTGQSKELGVTQVTEIEGGNVEIDDIRKLLMAVPFNPPSPVLFQLLGFMTDLGRNVIRTTIHDVIQNKTNMPVGTTLALVEEGMRVMSAIHVRLHASMQQVLDIVHRINKLYLDEDEVRDDAGEVLARRADFEGPMDVVPVSDPEIFSDMQRTQQLELVSQRAMLAPDLYNRRNLEKRILERSRIPNYEELMIPENRPQPMNQINENVAMALGRPVAAFPDQNHVAHISSLVMFMRSEVFGKNPIIAARFMPAALEHLKEHMVYYYVELISSKVNDVVEVPEQFAGTEDKLKVIMSIGDPETKRELDALLAEIAAKAMPEMEQELKWVTQLVQEAIAIAQKYQPKPQIPVDPNKAADTQQKREAEQMRHQRETQRDQAQEAREWALMNSEQRDKELERALEAQQAAAERVARLRELGAQERAEDERLATQLASEERRNSQDNLTALAIAREESESGERIGVSTGTGINP